jgi:hypothetical protein
MEGAEPIDPVHGAPTGPLPKRCVVGNGLNASPAFLYARMKGLSDTTAHFRGVYVRFFRTREACEAVV